MITGVIHSEEHGYGREHTKLAPAHIQVGVVRRVLFESAHAVAPVAHTRQTDVQSAPHHRFKPLPFGAPVACPDKGIALYAGPSLTGVVEAAAVIQCCKMLVGRFGIGYGKEIVQRLLLRCGILKAQGTAHVGLKKVCSQFDNLVGGLLPPPFHGLGIEEIEYGAASSIVNGVAFLPCIREQGVVQAVVQERADVQSEHGHMVLMGKPYHSCRVLEQTLKFERASAVAQ